MSENRKMNAPQGGPGMRGPGGGGGPRGPMVVEKPKNSKKTLIRLVKYLGASKYMLLSLIVLVVLSAVTQLAGPVFQKEAIDNIAITETNSSVNFNGLISALIGMGGVYLIGVLFSFLQGWIGAGLSQKTVRILRSDMFSRMSKLPVKYFDTNTHGELMSRLTNDIDNVSNALSQTITAIISSIITVSGALVMMLYYSPIMTVVALLVVPLVLFVSRSIIKKSRSLFKKQQEALGRLNGHIEEMITGQKTVEAFSRTNIVVDEFDQINADLRKFSIRAQIYGGTIGPVMNVIGNIGFVLVAISGGILASKGMISIGVIQAFVQYSKQFTRPINEIANQYSTIQSALSSAERVFDVMDQIPETDDAADRPFDPETVKGDVIFKDVNFGYNPDKRVLKDFSINVKAGQKIALVGPTGAGKTTVVNLITRFYDIDSGEILLDGENITDLPKKGLRSCIGIVLQDTVLFTGTIKDNIRFGRLDATDEEIYEAAKMANADRFIRRLPDGYETQLSEQGSNLSQGQRQLLSIARAVLADPKILILDEATSSIDTRTEMHIQKAMISLMKGKTSFIIAHRLSTIRDADEILVIDGGRIVERGNHQELLEQKGHYWKLYQSQFTRSEAV
ncbi:MAG: ABC transporter ATP-binding protein [Clostridia bacterium]|nr:ABC transporter ATP-binding protein [Clostridia bacterium]